MPTTSKMGIVYPSSSDLVKDGATNMGTIATTVDAKTGLILLNTTSFTGVSSQSINDVFSATYTNYRIVIKGVGTADVGLLMRMRVSGSDNTSSDYGWARWNARTGGSGSSGSRTDTSWTIGAVGQSRKATVSLDISDPFATANTSLTGTAGSDNGTYTYVDVFGATLGVTTSYTGFTLIVSSGTITGSVSVFGYNV
jgi:hypothetical protein